jgi:membrane-associated PAP2 superfamily phosphatase
MVAPPSARVLRLRASSPRPFAKLAKKFGAVLGPLLSIVGQVLSWGAKGAAFLAENMWMLSLFLTYVVYDRLRGWRIQGKSKS